MSQVRVLPGPPIFVFLNADAWAAAQAHFGYTTRLAAMVSAAYIPRPGQLDIAVLVFEGVARYVVYHAFSGL